MKTSRILAFLSLACLAACDPAKTTDFKSERANRLYQEAMDDYTAGRLDAAVEGFEKVLRADPGNASARFQLACLQQDSQKDYVGAFCNYREYLLFAPDSDKAKLAKDRLAICERLAADVLAKKTNLAGNAEIAEESARLRKSIEALQEEKGKLAAELESVRGKATAAERETERLRKLLASMSEDEDEPEEKVDIASVSELLDADDGEVPERASSLEVAKALNALAESEEADSGAASSLLPQQADDAKEKKKAAEESERRMKAARAAMTASIPDTYVVQEGDTLYKIAVRFYGRTSAWKSIREANKDTISTDGRVRTGQTLKLPK